MSGTVETLLTELQRTVPFPNTGGVNKQAYIAQMYNSPPHGSPRRVFDQSPVAMAPASPPARWQSDATSSQQHRQRATPEQQPWQPRPSHRQASTSRSASFQGDDPRRASIHRHTRSDYTSYKEVIETSRTPVQPSRSPPRYDSGGGGVEYDGSTLELYESLPLQRSALLKDRLQEVDERVLRALGAARHCHRSCQRDRKRSKSRDRSQSHRSAYSPPPAAKLSQAYRPVRAQEQVVLHQEIHIVKREGDLLGASFDRHGVLVNVLPDGPADQAGLTAMIGLRLSHVNGSPIQNYDVLPRLSSLFLRFSPDIPSVPTVPIEMVHSTPPPSVRFSTPPHHAQHSPYPLQTPVAVHEPVLTPEAHSSIVSL
ncbi:hypothetical protein DIPPA_22913 [Diplonema papillatum]|nr:hypothetical protein DIPPA_22913 [Diplonema papillatum]